MHRYIRLAFFFLLLLFSFLSADISDIVLANLVFSEINRLIIDSAMYFFFVWVYIPF